MQQSIQISAGARCLSVLITKSRFISFWSLAMKSSVSVFSFLHWGFTQSTNKRAKKVACFLFYKSSNLNTVHTVCLIFYNKIWSTTPLSIQILSATHFEDMCTSWLISKPEAPHGISGTAPKMRHQICACCIPFSWLLGGPAGPLCMHPGCLYILIPLILLHQVIPFA